MKYEEYIKAIAPFEDFKNRANNCSDNKFKNILMEAYDKGLHEIGRKILIENNITPNKLSYFTVINDNLLYKYTLDATHFSKVVGGKNEK